MPLAIELAAARVRALSLAEILDGLHDRFRLLTGGARTAVRRQQTLRASVDWSHALLTEPERVLFRRLAVFLGGFDLDAAQAVAGGGEVERYQVLDQLTLLVDKSLVVADNTGGRTRYRLLETVRQYALEKLGESGEADAVRSRHRDHYTAMAALLDAPARTDYERRVEQAETEIDNLRAAFGWSRENADIELALALASSLQPLWLTRGRIREGLAWFDAALADLDAQHLEVAAAVRARALADKAVLDAWVGAADSLDQAQQALAIAREVDDPALLARALTACGFIAGCATRRGGPAILRRGDRPGPGHGRPVAAEPDPRLAGAGARPSRVTRSRRARPPRKDATSPTRSVTGSTRVSAAVCLGYGADDAGRSGRSRRTIRRAGGRGRGGSRWDLEGRPASASQGVVLAYQGDTAAARAAADAAIEAAAELGGLFAGMGYAALAVAALAAGDAAAAHGGERGRAAAHECRGRRCGGNVALLQCRGRAGGRGSGRGPPLGRRGRLGDDRLSPVGGADDARPRGDRAR